ncbi:MAG TPA: BON domain-containing protein [Gemmatimonadales bacterium]|nr:BON domain-containing protein [Gemmatimonadales bacterium]
MDHDYTQPMPYDLNSWRYARSHPDPLGDHFGPVEWGGGGGRAGSTRMDPHWIDMRGALAGADYSSARMLDHPTYAGRGPKNHRRPDGRIAEDVCEALTVHLGVDASEIEVKVNDGEVSLTGSVEDRRMRRVAAEVAESVAGVRDVHTRVRVRERR